MASYTVDILVALKGAQKLTAFNKQIKETEEIIKVVNKNTQLLAKDNELVIKNVNNLSKALADSKRNFNEVALGTSQATTAAKEYLTALRNTNAALAEQKAAVVSLQNARQSDAFFLAQGARAGRQNRLDETQSQAISAAIARENNIRIQAELKNQELLKEVQTRAPRLPAFQERGLERLEDEFKKKKELTTLEENANKASKRRLNFQEAQNKELDRQKKLGIGVKKNEKLINASYEDRVKFAEKNGKIRRQALIRANNLLLVEKKITKQRAKQNQMGGGRTRGNIASSAIIGGAFPLLFGQTGAAAVGGGVGGALGGALGGQFGFALSILGTAIGSAVDKADKFNKSLVELNTRMGTTGSETAITAKEVNNLAKSLNITKEEVFGVLGAFREFGDGDIAKSMAMIFGTDAGGADRFAGLNRSSQLAQEIFDTRKQIGNEAAKELLIQNQSVDAAVVELALVKAKAKAEQDAAIARARAVSPFDQFRANTPGLLILRAMGKMKITDYGDIRAENLQKKFAEDNITLLESYKKGIIEARELLDLLRESQGQFGLSGNLQFTAVTDRIKDLQDEMKKLMNPINTVLNLSMQMQESFAESFKGIIKGTMSVSDAFRNMLNRIGDYFLDTAARMAANQLSQFLLGSIANAFTSSGTRAVMDDFGMSRVDASTISSEGFVETVFEPKATGGPVKRGGSYLVGERGPELFSPGVSGMITPNEMLGGSTNIVVNVDASGSSVEGDEEQGRELGRMISVAIQSELIKQKRPGGMLA